MKDLMKRILGGTIAAGMLAASLPALAAIPDEVRGTRFEEPVQILSALNIMVGDTDGKYRLDDTIIRSEAAKMAVHALGLENAAKNAMGQTNFNDVSADHWANGYINVANSQGLVVGDGDGSFRPNDPISYAEAMVIMVKATGYDALVPDKGGYPTGYMNVGMSNGLGDNIDCRMNEPISRGNVAYLTNNALTADLMEQTGYGSNARYERTDKTLLEEKLNVTKARGQVEAIQNTSLTGESGLGRDQIRIDGEVYDTAYNMNNLLGYNVEYYVKENKDGTREVILAMPIKNQNSKITVTSESFSRITEKNSHKAVEYFANENSARKSTAELSSDAVLIYNGKRAEMSDELLSIENQAGSITMLDTDKDSRYDIVFVTKYENIVVDSVTASNRIIDKYGAPALKLDDAVSYRLMKGANEINIEDLKEYDVLSVAASLDKEVYSITVTTDKTEGKVESSDRKSYTINGKRYEVAANYPYPIPIGTTGVFYLDAQGRIAAVDTSSNLSSNYAYLISAYTDPNREISVFKLFTKEGEKEELEANDRVKVNGRAGVKAADAVGEFVHDGVTAKQLVTYTTNSDGKLNSITAAKDNTETGAADTEHFTKNYSLTDAQYSAQLSRLGNVRIDGGTIVFNIPADSVDYSITDKSVFEDEQKYSAMVYDMTENYTAGVIVLTGSEMTASAEAPIAVVRDVMSGTNDKDEETDIITMLENGGETEMYAAAEGVLVKNTQDGTKPLAEGDIIQYKTNAEGEIVSVRVLLDIETKETEAVNEPSENLTTVYGKVTKKFANSVNVKVNDGGEVNYDVPSDVNVYYVDTTISRNNVLTADTDEILPYDAEEGNRIFIKIYKDEVREIVIVK